ncbi:type IV pilus twitching motility protein PilT [Planktothrix sp. FACHB-1365]|uniref:type IV pilus twitching motility protein PilT n=1 Tax=Planktothrix sp. FACHB-1365 TaxID=2692855 RepID=UPI0016865E36|nr:type IV pilus twitching motility protein PilT [Planktothrix sp. FACHB-1365]MBD2484532.1 type IV pilus twitching motility protein PilT [Planktothrix sp. FACHB-1365]
MTQSERPPVPRPPVPGIPPRPPAPKAPPPPGAGVASAAVATPTQMTTTTPTVMATPRSKGPSPGQPTLREIVKRANDEGASDVHLGVNEPPRFRKRGDIVPLEWPNTDLNTFMSWLMEVLTDEEIHQFQENLDFDGAADLGFVRIRISIFDALNGPSLVLRLIGSSILTLEQLKLPEVFKKICNYHKGLILVTGPTGSGKSTTLAAMIDYMNRNYAYNIITIEDPVEFVHESKKSLIKHREVGRHTLKFFNALKGALRQDPDVLLVGEIRDKETMQIALKAAQTGHLVSGTLHTNSAVKTLTRILDMFTAEEQPSIKVSISESLVAIIAQLLCKTTDGKRAAFHDVLINTDVIKEYIVKDKFEEINQIMLKDTYEGMTTMNKFLYNLYQEGRITEEICLEVSPFPNEMSQMLRGRV